MPKSSRIAVIDFAGYHELLAIHAEGSLEAQKITIFRDYDIGRCIDLVRELLSDDEG